MLMMDLGMGLIKREQRSRYIVPQTRIVFQFPEYFNFFFFNVIIREKFQLKSCGSEAMVHRIYLKNIIE